MRLPEQYKKEVIPEMMKKFGYKNSMVVPKILKVTVNTGFGKLISGKTSEEQKKTLNSILDDLAFITGQHPILTKSKMSIAGFKIRKGISNRSKSYFEKGKNVRFFRKINSYCPSKVKGF